MREMNSTSVIGTTVAILEAGEEQRVIGMLSETQRSEEGQVVGECADGAQFVVTNGHGDDSFDVRSLAVMYSDVDAVSGDEYMSSSETAAHVLLDAE